MSELGFVFKSENCIQCHACEAACKSWRHLENGVSWRRVHCLWHGSFPDTTLSTLSVSCMHCAEPACAGNCPTGAISKSEDDGVVRCDRTLCTGCRKCYDICPVGAPQFGSDGLMQKCDMCASGPFSGLDGTPCTLACPTYALWMGVQSADEKSALEKTAIV